ncbi:membrane-bound (NiFe)-hydrogenase (Ehf-type, Group 4f), transmembrane subunit A [Candidatus Sulfopaludibacter sp. SbA6]|nr:membrane-bound (NiFe)-hydrogenase (Ehf-type, Group 4f), transmembrane subunit A [Candidatus Sulfopaludibacter sp. SbA6]
MPHALYTAGLIAYLAGAAVGLAGFGSPRRARIGAFSLALAGALLEIAAAASAIGQPAAGTWSIPFGIPFFSWTVRLNALSAYFNLALGILSAAVSVYSLGYVRGMEGRRNAGVLGFFYNVLLLSLTLVFTAANAFFFLVAWEVMALSAYCLVSFEHEKEETRRAGIVFLIMSHAGTGLLLIAFLMMAQAGGSLDFAGWHHLASRLPAWEQGTLFVLFLLGFGVKAGIIPIHVWLPAAHPVAPSNISALMSGIVIKTGIYGMALVFFDFFDIPPVWAGMVVLGVGVLSALLGVLYALMEHDLKRLLAYHSIENIGIILIGFGAALVFRALGHPALAAIALIAGLYHTMNHAIFKGLLFLGAGSVLHATHTRNMEEMGGLIRRMPVTALCFLIGSIAISGLPPLNGFVSEWLTYQALLAGFGSTQTLARVVFPIAGALLALTAALAAACFVKAFGISFLALPRSEKAAEARESALSMRFGMGILAAGCVALGLGATWFLPIFDPITEQTMGGRFSALLIAGNGLVLSAGTPRGGTVSTAGIAAMLVLLTALPGLFWLVWGRSTKRAVGPTWDCGLPGLTAENEYTATGFSKPIRMIFSALYRPRREIQAEYEVSPYYPTAIHFESEIEPAFEKRIYDPFLEWLMSVSRRLRAVQAGSIHAYLAYIFLALIALLLFGVRG